MMADGGAIAKWYKVRQDQLDERVKAIIEGRVDMGDAENEIERA